MQVQATGRRREIDVTPVGWAPPQLQEMEAVIGVLAAFFGQEWLGFRMHREGLFVELIELDGVPVMARQLQARILVGALRQQQLLERLHETGQYDRVRRQIAEEAASRQADAQRGATDAPY